MVDMKSVSLSPQKWVLTMILLHSFYMLGQSPKSSSSLICLDPCRNSSIPDWIIYVFVRLLLRKDWTCVSVSHKLRFCLPFWQTLPSLFAASDLRQLEETDVSVALFIPVNPCLMVYMQLEWTLLVWPSALLLVIPGSNEPLFYQVLFSPPQISSVEQDN